MPQTVDSMSSIVNPTPISDASLANGRKYYQINCAVCHGEKGGGDGNATKFGFPAIGLLTPMTVNRTDGYIFGMIRNGRGFMPPYNRIEEMDRWDVVNYLRALQGKTGTPPATGPVGAPGETGDKLPGATRLGPTVPSHYRVEPAAPTPAAADTSKAAPRDTAAVRRPGGAQ
jgi:mono/diheme cytochrome c family protein